MEVLEFRCQNHNPNYIAYNAKSIDVSPPYHHILCTPANKEFLSALESTEKKTKDCTKNEGLVIWELLSTS